MRLFASECSSRLYNQSLVVDVDSSRAASQELLLNGQKRNAL
jgi:hypothetical protein